MMYRFGGLFAGAFPKHQKEEGVILKKMILGDQSPWNGGHLRALVASQDGWEVKYFLQDADLPWVVGNTRPKVCDGFVSYAALAARIPWTMECPSACLHAPIQSLKMARGFVYATGPNTDLTIWGSDMDHSRGRVMKDLCCEIHRAEHEHLTHLLRMTKMPPTTPWEGRERAYEVEDIGSGGVSLVEFFRDQTPLLLLEIPPRSFWEIDSDGRRRVWDGVQRSGYIYVPKCVPLLLELTARGYTIGHSNLPYLGQVQRCRDLHAPGLRVNLCRITFDWGLEENPITKLIGAWVEKRMDAGRSGSVSIDKKQVWKICDYWRRSPTSASWIRLGGDLRPRFDLETI